MKFLKPTVYFFLFSLTLSISMGSADAKNNQKMKYRGMDDNHDGVITRGEWNGNDQSFQNQDWNADGVLSGNEVRKGAHYSDEHGGNSFSDLDYNRNGSISITEWRGDRASFDRLDCNRNSSLTVQEFLSQADCNLTYNNASFRNLDTNNNGSISSYEWRGDRAAFDRLDCNRNASLTEQEFLSQAHCNTTTSTSNNTFRTLDTNNDGYLSASEWRNNSQDLSSKDCNRDNRVSRTEYFTQNCSSNTCDADCLFRELDVNNDGVIYRNEWRGNSQTFSQLDQNGSNSLSRNEFTYLNQNRQGTTQQVLGSVSDIIDSFLGQR